MKTAIGAVLVGVLLVGCGGRASEPGVSSAGAPGEAAGASGVGATGGDSAAGEVAGGSDESLDTPVVFGQQPGALAVDDTALYWINSNTPSSVSVESCSKTDCSDVSRLYTLQSVPDQLILSSDAVWTSNTDHSGVLSCSKQGCPEGPRVVLAGALTGGSLVAWATDGIQLAWATPVQINVCPTQQCTLDTSRVLLDVDHGYISALAIYAHQLYGIWASAEQVPDSRPLSHVFTIPLADATQFASLADTLGTGPFTLTDGHLFWVDAGDPQSNGDPLKPPPPTSWLNGSIEMLALGGSSDVKVLARNAQWYASQVIAADDSAAYWETSNSNGFAGIIRGQIDTPVSTTELLSPIVPSVTLGLAVDDQYVYWSNPDLGQIIKHAK